MSEEVSYYENSIEIEKRFRSFNKCSQRIDLLNSRTPVFICGNGEDLDGRVVVLRKADQQNNIIQYHSDIRSSKIGKIKKQSKLLDIILWKRGENTIKNKSYL